MHHVPEPFFLPSARFAPAYLSLGIGELRRRAEEGLELLRDCVACPRDCHVDRLADKFAVCKTGRYAIVSSFFPHFGEEDCLRGWNGSGTIFFSLCNLRCVFCFTGDVRIFSNRGLQRIESVFLSARSEISHKSGRVRFPEGLEVLTRSGEFRPVAKVFSHDYDGDVLTVKSYGLPAITLTPDHEVFASDHGDAPLRKMPARLLRPGLLLQVPMPVAREAMVTLDVAELLEPYAGTFRRSRPRRLSLPALRQIASLQASGKATYAQIATRVGYHPGYLRALIPKIRRGQVSDDEPPRNGVVEQGGRARFRYEKSDGVPARLPLNTDLARLLGYYCAEGSVISIARRPNSHRLVFSFGRHEGETAERIRALMQKMFGVEAKLVPRRTTLSVEVGRASLALLFKRLCGASALRKRVPEHLMVSPRAVVRAFLDAYLEGDGYSGRTYVAANTVSEELAYGVVALLLRLRILPYFYATERRPYQQIQGRKVRQSQILYYVKCRRDAWTGRPAGGLGLRRNSSTLLVPVRWVRRERYRGVVYNLEVDDHEHSYVANGIAVGNCQNYDISQLGQGRVVSPEQLARMMLFLQDQGCHNINFVTPEHVVPQILEALPVAVEHGLRLPIVYNTSSYDSLHSLRLMDGIVDVYMPDFKYWDREKARHYLKAPDYPEVARRTIAEMHRQVGPLTLDERGLAKRGVLLRHLVMPGAIEDTRAILRWIAAELSPHTYVNVMDQYAPAAQVGRNPKYEAINRRITAEELEGAIGAAREAGLYRLDVRIPRRPDLRWASSPLPGLPARP